MWQKILVCLGVCALLTACGQTGALYLPGNQKAASFDKPKQQLVVVDPAS